MSSSSGGEENDSFIVNDSKRPPIDISITLNPARKGSLYVRSSDHEDSLEEEESSDFSDADSGLQLLDYATIKATKPALPENTREKMQALSDWTNLTNRDHFLELVYNYYREGGYRPLVLQMLSNLAKLAFLFVFTVFLMYFIDWNGILAPPSGDAGHLKLWESVGLSVFFRRISMFGLSTIFVFGSFWGFQFNRALRLLSQYRKVHRFYHELLGLRDRELKDLVDFDIICDRISRLNEEHQTCAVTLDAREICSRIMRKDNYMVAMIDQGILNLGKGLPEIQTAAGVYPLFHNRHLFTKLMEWNLTFAIFGFTFESERNTLRASFLKFTQRDRLVDELRRRFRVLAVLNFILMPFVFIFVMVYYVFRYGEEVYKRPSFLVERQYSPLSRWSLREYNELEHLLEKRLAMSYRPAMKYLSAFEDVRWTAALKFVAFISGSIVLTLLVLALVNDDLLLRFELTPGKSVIWYLGVFGAILAVTRAAIPDRRTVLRFDRTELLSRISFNLHYSPEIWRTEPESFKSRKELLDMLVSRYVLFAWELLGLLLGPLILYWSMPMLAADIVDFFREHSVLAGPGRTNDYVCSRCKFEAGKMDNEAKMQQSILAFKATYPRWKTGPDAEISPNAFKAKPGLPAEDQKMNMAASLIASRHPLF